MAFQPRWAFAAIASLIVLVLGFPTALRAETYTAYAAREHQPEIRWSGRVNAVAIDPSNADRVLAGSETGGLWESFDAGASWRRVDALPVFNLVDIHFVAREPRIVLATALPDFNKISPDGGGAPTTGGGIWVSSDGGASWTQPTAAIPSFGRIALVGDTSCPPSTEAFSIDEDHETGRIFVATVCGVSYTDNIASGAAASWTHKILRRSLATPDARRFTAVAALEGPNVVLGGGDGAWWSDDNGESWRRSDTSIGAVLDSHAASGVVGVANAGFIVSIGGGADRRLWRTRNGGRTWGEVAGDPPNGAGCGGIAQVYGFEIMHLLERTVGVYYGNACSTYRYVFANNPFRDLPFGAGDRLEPTWDRLPDSHGDTRALAFAPTSRERADLTLLSGPSPQFLANDGGLDRLVLGRWTPIGSGPNGINALQIYDLEGQRVEDTGAYRLAFGTQDNGLWSSADETTWPQDQATGPEMGAIQMPKSVSSYDTERWAYVTCGDCYVQSSDPLFRNQRIWAGYATKGPGWGISPPRKVHPTALDGWHLQAVFPNEDLLAEGETLGLELSIDYGESYFRFHEPTQELRGDMNVNHGVIYQGIGAGTYTESIYEGLLSYKDTELLRISGILSDPLRRVEYPAMNGFGSIGHYAFQFAWAPVYAVNPSDTRHLIAPDVQNRDVKVSTDGGENWATIPGLTELITRGGQYEMAIASPWGSFSFSLISAISFFPANPDLVIIGAQLGGAYISEDGGARWRHVAGSDRINNILDFDWKSADEIYVASYGRGLWKIESTGLVFELGAFRDFLLDPRLATPMLRHVDFGDLHLAARPRTSASSLARAPQRPTVPLVDALKANTFDAVVIAVDGSITGYRPGKTLREQFVTTPGATLYVFASDPKAVASGKLRAAISKPASAALEAAAAKALAAELKLTPKPARDEGTVAYALMGGLAGDMGAAVIPPPKDGSGGGTTSANPGAVTVGVALKGRDIAGIIVGSGATHVPAPVKPETFTPAKRQSPAKFNGGHILVHATASVMFGGPVYSADHPIVIEGRDFAVGPSVTIEIDGAPIEAKFQPDSKGRFRAVISLGHLAPGGHLIRARQMLPGNVEDDDSAYILIQHHDEGPSNGETPDAGKVPGDLRPKLELKKRNE